jgi:hypothetical protein
MPVEGLLPRVLALARPCASFQSAVQRVVELERLSADVVPMAWKQIQRWYFDVVVWLLVAAQWAWGQRLLQVLPQLAAQQLWVQRQQAL